METVTGRVPAPVGFAMTAGVNGDSPFAQVQRQWDEIPIVGGKTDGIRPAVADQRHGFDSNRYVRRILAFAQSRLMAGAKAELLAGLLPLLVSRLAEIRKDLADRYGAEGGSMLQDPRQVMCRDIFPINQQSDAHCHPPGRRDDGARLNEALEDYAQSERLELVL